MTIKFKALAVSAFFAALFLSVFISAGSVAAPPAETSGAQILTAKTTIGLEKATFAGGCFWCMETPFYDLKGVNSVMSGYIGGKSAAPTYEQVSAGDSGHVEAVEVSFDPKVVSYQELLTIFWANIDPLEKNGQFCDKGPQYRSAIFTHTTEQAKLATASKSRWASDPRFAGQTLHTEIMSASAFHLAEEYHQKYSLKNPTRYKYYRWNCGRDQRLKAVWGDEAKH